MISSLFHAVFYNPIYNFLVFLVYLVPGGDVGLAIVLATLAIKLLLLPLSVVASRSQRELKRLEPLLAEVKKKHPDRQEQATKTMELYREHGVNPFAGMSTLFIQLPILIALYLVFRREAFPILNMKFLYSFIPHPATASLSFLGLIDVTGHSILLAFFAAATQFLQAHIMMTPLSSSATAGSSQGDFARMMQVQMKYLLPIVIAVVAYTSGAIALYFITSNLVGAFQEYFVLRKIRNTPMMKEGVVI